MYRIICININGIGSYVNLIKCFLNLSDSEYEERVLVQITMTLTVCCVLMSGILYSLRLCKVISQQKMAIGSTPCFLISALFLFEYCVRNGGGRYILNKERFFNKIFPWSMACFGISAILITISLCMCVYTYIVTMREDNNQPGLSTDNKSTAIKLEAFICVFSVVLQMVGYLSNGVVIFDYKFTEDDLHSIRANCTSSCTIHRVSDIKVNIGVWFITTCTRTKSSLECETIIEQKHSAYHLKEYEEYNVFHMVTTQVFWTIAIVCAIIASVLYTMYLCQRIKRQWMRYVAFVCGVVSGTIQIFYCSNVARYVYGLSEKQYFTVYFPWGLFTMGLGGICILIPSLISFIVLLISSKMEWENRVEFQMIRRDCP